MPKLVLRLRAPYCLSRPARSPVVQALAPLFEPILEAWYCKQMSERLFHNDETRWDVFVEIKGKVGTRWYLWVTRSQSVIFYCIDPAAAVPRSPARILRACRRTRSLSCLRPLQRLQEARPTGTEHCARLLLGVPVRRDFLDAGRAFAELEHWALEWKERIGTLYHLNRLRLEHWNPEHPLAEQSDAFNQYHEALQAQLQRMHEEATRMVAENDDGTHGEGASSTSTTPDS